MPQKGARAGGRRTAERLACFFSFSLFPAQTTTHVGLADDALRIISHEGARTARSWCAKRGGGAERGCMGTGVTLCPAVSAALPAQRFCCQPSSRPSARPRYALRARV